MLLSARMLKDVATVNSFEYTQTVQATEGDAVDVYFQLIDKSLDLATEGFSPAGRRYMPSQGATLQVTLQSIDQSKTVVRYATQPFTQDASIFKLSIMATDQLAGGFTMQLALNQGGSVTRGNVQQAVSMQSLTQAFC